MVTTARWLCGFGYVVLSACGGGGGGVTHYRPSEAPQRLQLDRDGAEVALIKALKAEGKDAGAALVEAWTGESAFRYLNTALKPAGPLTCSYAGTPMPDVPHFSESGGLRRLVSIELAGCRRDDQDVPGSLSWNFPGQDADRFADALFVLAHSESTDPAQDPEVQKAVQQYRAAGGRLQLTEAARAHRVAAEEAVKEKRFEDAVKEYGEALKLAPWWSQGHFNRALILAELGAYGAAGREMKRYLALEPDAENARQIQDKIYAWRAKVK